MVLRMASPLTFHSSFGGTWLDRSDAAEMIDWKLDHALIDDFEADQLRFWITNGYIILPGAVPETLCAELARDLAEIWRFGSESALMQDPTAPPGTGASVDVSQPADRMRLVDLYGCSWPALSVLTVPAIVRFLTMVFEMPPLLFQGLTFEKGSGQGLHQDTAYVVVDSPMEMAASWVALEDVIEGSGELTYISGSHRLPDFRFSDRFKHWSPERDGDEQHDQWAQHIARKSEEFGLHRKSFLPKRGDAFIWSADLVHGGSPVVDPALTRRSMVGHYCPVARDPHYSSYQQDRLKVSCGEAFASSSYYDVRSLPAEGQRAAAQPV